MKALFLAVLGAVLAASVMGLVSLFLGQQYVWLIAGLSVFAALIASYAWTSFRIKHVLKSPDKAFNTNLENQVSATLLTERAAVESALREGLVSRKLAEEHAAESQRVLAALIDPVIVFDHYGEVIEANPAAELMAVCETNGRPSLTKYLGDSMLSSVLLESSRGTGIGEIRRFEHETHTESKDSIAWEISVRRLDATERWVAIFHDVTRDREVARMKSDFVTKASHELRTPLSSIHAYIEMLADGEVEDEHQQKEFLRIVHEESDRLSRLIDNMLDISRIEAGVANPHRSAVNLASVAERVLEAMRAGAAERSIDLVIRANGEDLMVEGDEDMLAEVIQNLVGNAVKYTPEGGRVAVSIDPDDLTASIVTTVTDTGLGIPPDDIDHLFEKFYRISRYERTARGTGLGLNLCRNIVEEVHQGRIGVDSTLGMGSRFWFSVPVQYSGARAA